LTALRGIQPTEPSHPDHWNMVMFITLVVLLANSATSVASQTCADAQILSDSQFDSLDDGVATQMNVQLLQTKQEPTPSGTKTEAFVDTDGPIDPARVVDPDLLPKRQWCQIFAVGEDYGATRMGGALSAGNVLQNCKWRCAQLDGCTGFDYNEDTQGHFAGPYRCYFFQGGDLQKRIIAHRSTGLTMYVNELIANPPPTCGFVLDS